MKSDKKQEEILLEIIDNLLNEILGDSTTEIIYNYLEEKCKIKKQEIPYKMEEFKAELNKIFGDASKMIEEKIKKALFKKEVKENE